MTRLVSLSTPLDVLGIGFGPSNIALAIALDELAAKRGHRLESLFLERQQNYSWHGNTIVAQSDLQISFLKDLVSLRDPTSRFTFINYLHSKGRLIDFINLKTFFPCRMEFNDYLRWVADHFADDCIYGEEAVSLEPVQTGRTIDLLKVHTCDAAGREHVRHTRSLVISTGGTPHIPGAFSHLAGNPQVFHHARYLDRMARMPTDAPMRVVIIGGGQSAAEAFIDLNDSYPQVSADMIIRGAALKPSDDSPFVNEIFSPSATDEMFSRSEPERVQTIRDYRNTNYSVVNIELIHRIYEILYRQKISGNRRHSILSQREIVAASAEDHGIAVAHRDLNTGNIETRTYDAVILATGYDRNAHGKLLASLAEYLGDFQVDRHYRLSTSDRLTTPIFLQGYSQSSHGLSDTLLSVLPIRAEEIATALHNAILHDAILSGSPNRQSPNRQDYVQTNRSLNVGNF